MGRAIDFHIREQIISDCESGLPYSEVSRKYSVRYNTVKELHVRFKKSGKDGLLPKYQNCGKEIDRSGDFIFRAVCWLKYLHPQWGAPYILIRIKDKYPEVTLPSARTAQRWFREKGLNKPKTKIPKPKGDWAKSVHEVWQIDAKERIVLADGSKGCWLTVVDEKSGATLATVVFPPQPYLSGSGIANTTNT